MEKSQEIFLNKLTDEKHKRQSDDSIQTTQTVIVSLIISFILLFFRINLTYLGYYILGKNGWAPMLSYLDFLGLSFSTHFLIQYIKSIFKK